MPQLAPYGAWVSPLSAADAARACGRPDWVGWVGDEIWWTEPRPSGGGRVTLVRHRPQAGTGEVIGPPWNVRSRIIEYGGRPWAAAPGRGGAASGPLLVFVNWSDQRLYRYEPDNAQAGPQPLSPVPECPSGMRFADFFIHPDRDEIWGVRETLTGPSPTDIRRDIVAVPLDGSAAADRERIRVLAVGQQFLASLRLSPEGARLAWIGWDHPSMPWDKTTLWVAEVSDGSVGRPWPVAGGPGACENGEAIVQAEWLSTQSVAYISDASGWWNLYRADVSGGGKASELAGSRPVGICPRDEEFGDAIWQLGRQWFVPLAGGAVPGGAVPGGGVAAIHGRDATRLSVLDPWEAGEPVWGDTALPGTVLAGGDDPPSPPREGTSRGAALASEDDASRSPRPPQRATDPHGPDPDGPTPPAVPAWGDDPPTPPGRPGEDGTRRAGATPRTLSTPYTEWAPCLAVRGTQVAAVAASPYRPYEVILADTETGVVTTVAPAPADGVDPAFLPLPRARTFRGPEDREVHATVYPPRNPGFAGPAGEPPPYVVFVHGGPTSRCLAVYDLEIAYFTSRGIGVVEVDYGGSTGHGRAYRDRLKENWGVVDVDDCAAVAMALAAEGTADERRLAIRGGSAGGWTTAVSLIRASVYQGGIIYYPILDLAGWRTGETHDFESQYLDSLVGPWPQASDVYHERSPVNHADKLSVPFLLLQGLEDAVCPPAQCERFLGRVTGRGMQHAYLAFEGEQHGFRKAETIAAALEAELSFLGQVLGFEPVGVPVIELAT